MAITIRIDVDKAELISKLEMFKGQMQFGLLPAFQRISRRLHNQEVAMAPVDTGRLRGAIQTVAGPMSVVSVSMAIDPRNGFNYARIQHDGGYASGKYGPHYITGKFYMTTPLKAVAPYAVDTISDEIDRIIARCGLG